MAKKLVIVESVSKAKTIQKYLGKGYEVIPSAGHVKDLPKSKLGVDIENGFTPNYIEMRDKKAIIKQIKEKAKECDYVYLAGDPDREGEAISWHLCHVLGLDINDNNRITFNEITKNGVENGIKNPRKIDMDLVDSQQARRVLDRIVGYKLSPFLWKKVKRGLSAGRCQSAALKIVVDREKEIRNFVPEEYWSIDASLQKSRSTFDAYLALDKQGKKLKIENGEQANSILVEIENAEFVVKSVKTGTRKKQPSPPFITSTLQQEASRKLNFNAQKTMRVAQALYEGVDIQGQGATGLITYMRTDSLRISEEARATATNFIKDTFGENYLPSKPRYFKTKKGAQDAHEAIRPTNPLLTPESVKSSLTTDQYKLYKLVWERFIASLMECCVQNTANVDIDANGYTFKASGYSVKFDGFTKLYVEGKDEAEEATKALPELCENDVLKLKKITPNQHFTQPPSRFTEASLIKMLEESGIGRPSTFATTVSTIISREYVEREKKLLIPTKLGEIITDLLADLFPEIVDQKFTAKVENQLDAVEAGDEEWKKMLTKFYSGFNKSLVSAEKKMDGTKVKVPEEESDVVCEKCGRKMVVRSSRFGKFLACPGYPECKNTKSIVTETKGSCPKCGSKIIERKSARGYKYYGCEKGKDCGFMTWDVPTDKACPNCGKTLFKRRGGLTVCNAEGCGYETKTVRKKKAKTDEE